MKTPARRRKATPATPAPPATDWRAVEAATSAWEGWRITGEDLDRVAAFFETRRAKRLHEEIIAFQSALLDGLKRFDWTETDAATLFGVLALATYLRETRDSFPPGDPPTPQTVGSSCSSASS